MFACEMFGGAWSMLMMVLGALVMLALAGVLVWVAYRLLTSRQGGTPRPEEELARRLARGEIDEEEYRARLAVLRTDPDASSWGGER